MAPPIKQDYYIYLEDYIFKERNLRYLFRKLSQNFIVQESFSETLQRNQVISQEQLKSHPYICDFMLLELMDAIWISEIYKPHRLALFEIAKKEVESVHTLQRYTELEEKKETFRKVINLVN